MSYFVVLDHCLLHILLRKFQNIPIHLLSNGKAIILCVSISELQEM